MQVNGLKWLYEMELVNDPQLINHLKLNVLARSKYIREVEILSSYSHKSMLVFVEMGKISKFFFKKRIEMEVLDLLRELLPNFRFRVIFERDILNLAIDQVKGAMTSSLKGEQDEETNDAIDSDASTSDDAGEA